MRCRPIIHHTMERTASEAQSPPGPVAKRPKLEAPPAKGVGELYMYDMQADQRFKIGRTSGNDSSVRRKALQTDKSRFKPLAQACSEQTDTGPRGHADPKHPGDMRI